MGWAKKIFIHKCEELELRGSGWTLNRINYLRINKNKYSPLSASI